MIFFNKEVINGFWGGDYHKVKYINTFMQVHFCTYENSHQKSEVLGYKIKLHMIMIHPI